MSHKKKSVKGELAKDAVMVAAAEAGRRYCHNGHHGHHRPHHHAHFHKLLTLFALGALAAAIYEELKKPAHARDWHGYVAGVVPYDFRVPTPEKVVDRVWNPDGPVLSPTTFGVGWDPNVGRIVEEIKAIPLRDDPHFEGN